MIIIFYFAGGGNFPLATQLSTVFACETLIVEDITMASPALQPMCCWFIENDTVESDNHTDDDHDGTIIDWWTLVVSYNSLCIMASCLSILGAIYQLLPRRPAAMPRTEKEMESFLMQNRIVCWLTLVDFLASLGVYAVCFNIIQQANNYISERMKYCCFIKSKNIFSKQ